MFGEAVEFLVHRLDLDLPAVLGQLVLERLLGLVSKEPKLAYRLLAVDHPLTG